MAEADSDRDVFCSGCYEIFPEPDIHVVPSFNDSAGDFVTSYRCGKCWLSALDDTVARVRSAESLTQLALLAAFFERHSIVLHEFRRGEPMDVVHPLLFQLSPLTRPHPLQPRNHP